jgi:hypothetical protein
MKMGTADRGKGKRIRCVISDAGKGDQLYPDSVICIIMRVFINMSSSSACLFVITDSAFFASPAYVINLCITSY